MMNLRNYRLWKGVIIAVYHPHRRKFYLILFKIQYQINLHEMKIKYSIVLIRIRCMKQGEVLLIVTLFVWVVIQWRRLWSDYFEACNDSKSCLLRYNELWYKEYVKENNIQLHDSFVKRPKFAWLVMVSLIINMITRKR